MAAKVSLRVSVSGSVRGSVLVSLLAGLVGLVPVAGTQPSASASTATGCRVGPRLTPSGGRRWWSNDQHCYTSPWFAGRHKIMLGFGCTPAPYYAHDARCPGRRGFHHGIDVDMPTGTRIFSAVNGVVVSTAHDGPAYGTHPVKIRAHGRDVILGHLSKSLVYVGQRVHRGQLVGLSGQSGAPDGPHLHFEVRPAGASYTSAVPPRRWLHLTATTVTTPPTSPAQRSGPLVLGGVRVGQPAGTQVVTVDHTTGFHARIALWQQVDGRWVRRAASSDARIGYGGLVAGTRRRQGTGTTPLGTYRLVSTFGSRTQATGWRMPYQRFGPGDYWVEDKASTYFNRMRNRSEGGFRWRLPLSAPNGSERLAAFGQQYQMAVVIGFNYDNPVPRRGGGIFLHVNGSGATAGCVSAPRSFIASVMADLDPADQPVIAIGT